MRARSGLDAVAGLAWTWPVLHVQRDRVLEEWLSGVRLCRSDKRLMACRSSAHRLQRAQAAAGGTGC